jgi:hypothetical protein
MKKSFIILFIAMFSILIANSIDSDCAPISATINNNSISAPVLNTNDPGDPITWTTLTPSPAVARYWCPGHGVVRDTIWFCGGRTSAVASINEIIAYVPANNTWVTTGLPTLLTARRAGGGGRIGNKIYVACGRDNASTTLATCEEFDVDTKVVTTKASAPAASWACAGGVAGGKLYIVGNESYTGTCYEYDPALNTWATKANIPVGRGWSACVGIGNKLYVLGGIATGSNWLSDCYEFDPTANTWTAKASMPGPRGYHTAVAVNDQDIYVVGGSVSGGACDNIVYKYNVASNTWTTEVPMPTARGWEMANQVGSAIYVSFGSDATTPTYLQTNERGSLAPPPQNDVGVMAIRSPGGNHTPNTPMTVKATVKNFGLATQTNFAVVCSVVGATGTVRHTNSQTVATLASNDTALVTFTTFTPTIEERCTVKVRTNLLNDTNPANDRMTRLTDVTSAIYITIGTGTSASGTYALYGYYNYTGSNAIYLQSEIGNYGPISHFAYYKGGGTVTSGFDDVRIFMRHTSATQVTSTGPLDTTGFTRVYAGTFPIDAVGWCDVTLTTPFLYNNSDNLEVMALKGPPAITSGYPTWQYTSTSPNYLNRYGYNASVWPTTTTRTYSRPNIRLMLSPISPPANDFSVQAIHSPGGYHSISNPINVVALIKNVGAANQTNVPVICSIVGAGGQLRHSNTQNLSINAGDTARANFTAYTPSVAEIVTVIVRSKLPNDTNPTNDRLTKTCEIHSSILFESFDDVTFPPAGWTVYNYGATPGDAWARQTSYFNSAPACAYIYYDLPNNDWLITPRIRRTGPADSLIFWYRNHTTSTSYYESLLVRVSTRSDVSDTAQYNIIGTIENFNNTTWWRAAYNLSSLGESLYIAFYYKNYNDWGMAVDDIRVSGAVSAIEENFTATPKATTLNAPRPNPVINSETKISFNLAQPSKANLTIYDASGRIVRTLVNGYLDKGIYNYNWNGTDDNNRKVAEGIYFYTLKTSNDNYTKKLIFTR